MSKKMQIPDEILDAVSGGTLFMNGRPVDNFDVTETDSTITISVTTDQGTFQKQMARNHDEHVTAKTMFGVYDRHDKSDSNIELSWGQDFTQV